MSKTIMTVENLGWVVRTRSTADRSVELTDGLKILPDAFADESLEQNRESSSSRSSASSIGQ